SLFGDRAYAVYVPGIYTGYAEFSNKVAERTLPIPPEPGYGAIRPRSSPSARSRRHSPVASPGVAAEPTPLLTRADVAHVASLARLELSEEELDLFTGQLAQVLDHA